jgi:6-phosphogluconolactonase
MGRDAVRSLRLVGLVVVMAALLVPTVAGAAKKKKKPVASPIHFLFSQTNAASNSVYVFKRNPSTGTISLFETVATGGKGTPQGQQPFGLPVVDSADSIVLSPDRKLLFVVNDGSNNITSFRVRPGGITRADIKSSHGTLPISLAIHGNLLYVLNAKSGGIFGYHYNANGKLTPIAHSKRSLSIPGPNGVAADIGFNPSGKWLVVTMRDLPTHTGGSGQPGKIDTFKVHANGTTGPAIATTAATPTPFGFRFTSSGIMLDTSAGRVNTVNNSPPPLGDGTQINGSLQSYALLANGKLAALKNGNAASGGRAACWVVISKNNRFAFVTNTLSATAAHPAPGAPIGTGQHGLARFSISSKGVVKFLGNVDTGPGLPSDLGLSPDGKYLYMADPSEGIIPGLKSHIEVYKVGSGGSLTAVQKTPPALAVGLSGIATT